MSSDEEEDVVGSWRSVSIKNISYRNDDSSSFTLNNHITFLCLSLLFGLDSESAMPREGDMCYCRRKDGSMGGVFFDSRDAIEEFNVDLTAEYDQLDLAHVMSKYTRTTVKSSVEYI